MCQYFMWKGTQTKKNTWISNPLLFSSTNNTINFQALCNSDSLSYLTLNAHWACFTMYALCGLKHRISYRHIDIQFTPNYFRSYPLQRRHNGHDDVSIHHPYDYLLNRLFRRRSKKTSKLCVTGLCEGNSPVTGEFHTQRTGNAENVSIWWRHHAFNGRDCFR